MKLPKELTTVTKLSKYLARLVFITLPVVGFFLGMRYQEMVDLTKRQEMEANLSISSIPTPTPIAIPTTDPSITANWKMHKDTKYGFSVSYPSDFKIDELEGVVIIYTGEKRTLPPNSPLDPYPTSIAIYDRSNPKFKNAVQACEAELCVNLSNSAIGSNYKKEEIMINNASGLKVTNKENSDLIEYYLSSDEGDEIVRISLGSTEKNYDLNLLLKILSTFKFLP